MPKLLPYVTLYAVDHAVIGVWLVGVNTRDRSIKGKVGQTFSELSEDPKSWAAGFLVAYRFAGGDGEII